LHPTPYIEISGVCTHPDYVGRGLGAALTYYQVRRELHFNVIQRI
jgi:predicted GNAT family acetyltransferase